MSGIHVHAKEGGPNSYVNYNIEFPVKPSNIIVIVGIRVKTTTALSANYDLKTEGVQNVLKAK
jgi:hypothetical protein